METIKDYPCSCGGTLKTTFCPVEFFGIDFGEQPGEVCTTCGAEYLDDATMERIEEEVKKRKLFGLERHVGVVKSGNSLVFRIPQEIVKFTGIKVKDQARIFPIDKKRIEIVLTG